LNTTGPFSSNVSIALLPKLEGLGGPTSFQRKLISGLSDRGIRCHFNPADPTTKALLIIGGTKHLGRIWQARRKGVRIVQRLNGMNWIHKKRNTGLKHYLRAEYGNFNLSFIRKNLTDYIVYQSQFASSWWQTSYGQVHADASVVYNGVDLDFYHPSGAHRLPEDHIRILLVEGHLGGGNEEGLINATKLTEILSQRLSERVELMVAGDVPESLKKHIHDRSSAWVTWA
jgi:glycosyltransferase involved in cell wall biosynthesis